MKKLMYTLAAIGLTTGTAFAQGETDTVDAAAPAAEAAPMTEPDPVVPAEDPATTTAPAPAAPAPAAPAAPAAPVATTFTDAEIDSFAKAAVKVQTINADATLDATAKQSASAAAVTEAGLDPVKYNEIARAASADPALLAKVQSAASKHSQPTG